MGGLLAGVEHRLQGYVLMVGDGGLVSHCTGPEDMDWWLAKPEDVRRQWLAWMWPIEPIHYVRCGRPPPRCCFRTGRSNQQVPPADALRYQRAGSEPKTVRWYKASHGLDDEAFRDQAEWLSDTIGITSYRAAFPPSIRIALTAWFLLTAGSLAFLGSGPVACATGAVGCLPALAPDNCLPRAAGAGHLLGFWPPAW